MCFCRIEVWKITSPTKNRLALWREEGCPPPQFEANESRVICLLYAHPRHTLAWIERKNARQDREFDR